MAKTNRMYEFFGFIGSAVAVASAAEAGRQPKLQDLNRLGIDPQQFRAIRRS